MMPDKAGDFIKSLPVTLIAILSVSLFLALTLNPLIVSWFFKNLKQDAKRRNFIPVLLTRFIEAFY